MPHSSVVIRSQASSTLTSNLQEQSQALHLLLHFGAQKGTAVPNMAGSLALSKISMLYWMLGTQSINIKYSIQFKSGKSFRNMGAEFEVESRFVQGMKVLDHFIVKKLADSHFCYWFYRYSGLLRRAYYRSEKNVFSGSLLWKKPQRAGF